jgi:hypothetical protein
MADNVRDTRLLDYQNFHAVRKNMLLGIERELDGGKKRNHSDKNSPK